MNAPSILLVLVAFVVIFGFAVVFVDRKRSRETSSEAGFGRVQSTAPSLRHRLTRTATAFSTALAGIRQSGSIASSTWDDLEAMLLRADVGLAVTSSVLAEVRSLVEAKTIRDVDDLIRALQESMSKRLFAGARELSVPSQVHGKVNVWLLVGVNGVGKTTTAGKLASRYIAGGHSVLLAAGDTFRAAAAEQLEMWAQRTGADIVRGSEGGDPSSVIFDAIQRAGARDIEIVIADTAGRLHNKSNLMEELRKVRRIADREPGRVTEVLLVIDATTGQNGLAQAREFTEVAEVTGVILTKMDGSAKGGIVFAIESELGLPVKFVGIGETVDDLVPFDSSEFVATLFET